MCRGQLWQIASLRGLSPGSIVIAQLVENPCLASMDCAASKPLQIQCMSFMHLTIPFANLILGGGTAWSSSPRLNSVHCNLSAGLWKIQHRSAKDWQRNLHLYWNGASQWACLTHILFLDANVLSCNICYISCNWIWSMWLQCVTVESSASVEFSFDA